MKFSKRQFPIIVLSIIAIDQIIKAWYLISGKKFIKNSGIAFGMLPESSYLSVLILVILIALIFYLIAGGRNVLPTAMIIGGGISNLVDRAVRGYVIDYLFINPLPVFNLADLAVVLGVVFLVWGNRSSAQTERGGEG